MKLVKQVRAAIVRAAYRPGYTITVNDAAPVVHYLERDPAYPMRRLSPRCGHTQ